MRISAGILLIWIAVAVSATPSEHHAVHRRNVQDNPGKGGRPGQQISGHRGVIGSPDDERASRRVTNDSNGNQDSRRGFGAAQTLQNGREGLQDYGGNGNPNNDGVVESRRRDNIGQLSARPFEDRNNNEGTEPASSVGQRGPFSNDGGRLGDLRRGYRRGYHHRVPNGDDSHSREEERAQYRKRYGQRVRGDDDNRSSEEDRPEYRRRYRPRVRSDNDSRSREESQEYGRRYRSWDRSDEDNRSIEEDRPRSRERRPYPRPSGDDASVDEVRRFGRRRRTASSGFDRSG